MGQAPKNQVERLAAEVSVERLAESRGIELVRSGSGEDLCGSCPLCRAEAGLRIGPAANRWSCGKCGQRGGPVEWVVATKGVSEAHAIELLREGLPIEDEGGRVVQRSTRRLLESPFEAGMSDSQMLAEVVGFYHRTFKMCPEPAEFLERRGLWSGEMVETFRLGFSNRTLCYRVEGRNRDEGGELRAQLTRLGVWGPKGHEAYRGSLTVPFFDDAGRVTQLYGRKIGKRLRKGTEAHTWLRSPARPFFNATALAAGDEVILAGSVIDGLTLWCAGFRHVVAVDGVEGFDPTHLKALQEHGTARVLIAFRRDEAGETAARRLAKELLAEGVECFRVTFPDGMDANDYVCQSASGTDALAKVLRGASWMGRGLKPGRRPATAHTTTTGEEQEPRPPTLDDPEVGPSATTPAAAVGDVTPTLGRDGDEMTLPIGPRRWRVRGLAKNTSFDAMRVNVMVSVPHTERGAGFHFDTLDLLSSRARASFAKEAAAEIECEEAVVRRELGRVYMACEDLVEEAIRRAQEPTEREPDLDPDERARALELLQDPNLVDRVTADFGRAGIVGETTNCLVGYLAATSRLLDRPLAVIVQSTSAAGKSALMDAVLDFLPDEAKVTYSAMTGQSLYYMGDRNLSHRVLAIAEEEGAERASYALKLLQSEGEVSIASTGKNTDTGRLVTQDYEVKGPAAIFLTTTAIDVDPELLNRCVVLTVDENAAQTRAIHDRQRRADTLDGHLAASERGEVVDAHRLAQRLLARDAKGVRVVNPYADRLTFADSATRTRRDHVKYLTLIRAIALLHLHQRPHHTAVTSTGRTFTYIEATLSDIALANRLAHEVLGTSLDELGPQTRRLLEDLDAMVTSIAESGGIDRDRVRFTRRQVRERTGRGDTQLKVHLARLVELELVWAHRAERGTGFVYELAWSGERDRRHLAGLVDVDALTTTPDPDQADAATGAQRSAPEPDRSGGGGQRSGAGRARGRPAKAQANAPKPAPVGSQARASGEPGPEASSYPHPEPSEGAGSNGDGGGR